MTKRQRQAAWLGIVLACVVAFVTIITSAIIGAVNSTMIREQQTTNTRTLDSTDRTLRLVEDCTTPGGECYERGRESTADAVGDIGRVTVLAAACAASIEDREIGVPARAALIQDCIVAQLDTAP